MTQQISIKNIFAIKHFANSIDDGKLLVENAFDIYTSAVKGILEWCSSTAPLLDQRINGNDDSKSQVQKHLLTTTLNDGMQKMRASQPEISNSVSNFNPVIASTGTLLFQITADFNNKTEEFKKENRKFYENLKNKVKNLNNDVSNFKNRFQSEIQIIADLRMQIEKAETFLSLDEHPDFRDEAHESVEKLITKCNRYRKRHQAHYILEATNVIFFDLSMFFLLIRWFSASLF